MARLFLHGLDEGSGASQKYDNSCFTANRRKEGNDS